MTALSLCVTISLLSMASLVSSSAPVSLHQGVMLDKKKLLRQIAKAQFGVDTCFDVEATNSGLIFKTEKEGVLFQPVDDNRIGYEASDCEPRGDKTCFVVRVLLS